MPKEFYTERDIEDLFKRGVMSLEVGDNVVLTELAYERARRLGMQLQQKSADNPPAAPVRPYLAARPGSAAPSGNGSSSSYQPTQPAHPASSSSPADLQTRIRTAVLARLGTQVDPALLDVIIQRVLNTTGLK